MVKTPLILDQKTRTSSFEMEIEHFSSFLEFNQIVKDKLASYYHCVLWLTVPVDLGCAALLAGEEHVSVEPSLGHKTPAHNPTMPTTKCT